MFTATHLPIGLIAGGAVLQAGVFPSSSRLIDVAVLAGVAAGSVLADAHAAVEYVRVGKESLANPSKIYLAIQEVTHSIVVWMVLAGISVLAFRGIASPEPGFWRLMSMATLAMLFGWFAHVAVDKPFHTDEKYRPEDPTWIWPLNLLLDWLFPRQGGWSLHGVFSFTDWRHWAYEDGRMLSWQDGAISASCLFLSIVLMAIRWRQLGAW